MLAGYTEVSFAGESVSDRLLVEVASRAGPKLTKIKLHNTKTVTDASLCTLVQSAPQLLSFVGDEMEKASGAHQAARCLQDPPQRLCVRTHKLHTF